MDGIALALETASNWPGRPILLMPGFADQRERAQDLTDVIRNVVTKPFTLRQAGFPPMLSRLCLPAAELVSQRRLRTRTRSIG